MLPGVKARAIVNGRVVQFSLSRGLAAAHRHNRGRTMTAAQAVAFVETKRKERAEKWRLAYREDRH